MSNHSNHTNQQFNLSELLSQQAKILESDSRGAKALLLNDTIYKVFYNTRHPIRGKLFPKSKQFAKNCQKLNSKGFIAPVVNNIHYDTKIKADILSYQCIEGISVREYFHHEKNTENKDKTITAIADLMSNLHKKGILFRSFHLGNILIDDKKLALIDVADLKIFPFSLGFKQRLRNFRHLTRVIDDKLLFTDSFIETYSTKYAEINQLSQTQQLVITTLMQDNIKAL